MKINFDFQHIIATTSQEEKKNDEVITSENNNTSLNLETSSANDFHAFVRTNAKTAIIRLFDFV